MLSLRNHIEPHKWLIVAITACNGRTLIPALISNYTRCKMLGEIIHPFINFNGATVEVWEWITNFILHFTGYVITYSCWDEINRADYLVQGVAHVRRDCHTAQAIYNHTVYTMDVRKTNSNIKMPPYNLVLGEQLLLGQRKKVTAVTFLPARLRPDQRGTNTGQIRKVPLNEIACFWCIKCVALDLSWVQIIGP